MPRVVGLSHVGLFVRDLQQSKEFYTRLLGLTVTDENDRFVFLSAQPEREHHELALLAGREAPPGTAIVQQVSFRCPTRNYSPCSLRLVRRGAAWALNCPFPR